MKREPYRKPYVTDFLDDVHTLARIEYRTTGQRKMTKSALVQTAQRAVAIHLDDPFPLDLSDPETFALTAKARPPFECTSFEFERDGEKHIILTIGDKISESGIFAGPMAEFPMTPHMGQPLDDVTLMFHLAHRPIDGAPHVMRWTLNGHVAIIWYSGFKGGSIKEFTDDQGREGYVMDVPGHYLMIHEDLTAPSTPITDPDHVGLYVPTVLSASALIACSNIRMAKVSIPKVTQQLARSKGRILNAAWTIVLDGERSTPSETVRVLMHRRASTFVGAIYARSTEENPGRNRSGSARRSSTPWRRPELRRTTM